MTQYVRIKIPPHKNNFVSRKGYANRVGVVHKTHFTHRNGILIDMGQGRTYYFKFDEFDYITKKEYDIAKKLENLG